MGKVDRGRKGSRHGDKRVRARPPSGTDMCTSSLIVRYKTEGVKVKWRVGIRAPCCMTFIIAANLDSLLSHNGGNYLGSVTELEKCP